MQPTLTETVPTPSITETLANLNIFWIVVSFVALSLIGLAFVSSNS